MRIDHSFVKDGNKVVSTTLAWEFNDKNINLRFHDDAHAIFSDELENVLVELFRQDKIIFYSPLGECLFEIPLPSLDGYSYWGLNKSRQSRTGVSVIFNPEDEDKKTKWNDMVQHELLTVEPYVGGFLNIYR